MTFVQTAKSDREDMLKEQQARLVDADTETLAQKRRILTWLQNNQASYLGEIAWEANVSEYQCKNVLNVLWREGLVENITVSFDRPDARLMLRVADQSAVGQAGYENFSRKKWFGITEGGKRWLREGSQA
jgi:hypothetical protein